MQTIDRRSLLVGGAATALVAAGPASADDALWLGVRASTEVLIEQFAGPAWRTVGTSTGAPGDGPDETIWLQAAIDHAAGRGLRVVVTPGVHRLTRTVGSNEPGVLAGDIGPMPYSLDGSNLESVPASLRRGSWLFLDHAGRGVQYGRDHAIAGVTIETLGFLRPHAAPGTSSWSPRDADYDIVGSNCDLLVRDTLHLCSPRGLLHNYGGYGRFEAERVRGQFFAVGIRLDGEFDLPRIRDCHFWPFWSQDPTVLRTMRDKLEAIQFDGVDGAFLSDFFCIGANRALAYYQTGGHTDRVHQATNLYTDVGGTGIYVDPGVTQGITLDVANWMCNAFVPDAKHPPTTSPGLSAWALDVRGDRCEIAVTGMRAEWMPDGLVRLMGEGNIVQVGVSEAFRWNRNGNGAAAFDCGAGNRLTITGDLPVDGDANAGPANLFSGAGTIRWPLSERTGVATVSPRATTMAVAHGQARPPTAGQCRCWFAGNPAAASRCWIDAITPSHLTLTVDTPPGRAIVLGWEANAFG